MGVVIKSPTKGPFLSFTLSTTPCRWWLSFSCIVSSTITNNPTRSTAHSPHLYPPITPPRPLIIQLPAADGDRTVVEGPGCRDPSSWEHVPRTSWWHEARITIRIHVTRLSYPDCLKEGRTTLISIKHPDGFHNKYIRMTNISHPNIIVRVIDWSKQVLHVITTACHGPRSTTCRVKRQDEVTTSHFPRSLHTITYHDLCQPPVGWW